MEILICQYPWKLAHTLAFAFSLITGTHTQTTLQEKCTYTFRRLFYIIPGVTKILLFPHFYIKKSIKTRDEDSDRHTGK